MNLLMSAALLPALLLMLYIRQKDKIEQEPLGLVLSIAALGALTTITATILEEIGETVLSIFLPQTSIVYTFLFYFVFVAGSEELGKFVVMKLRTWKSKEFNYTYDAVVYAVAASLGFAALENVLYVIQGGFGTALMRALTSLPGHTVFGVFMGLHYGLARRAAARGDQKTADRELRLSFLVPVLIHGFYDFCLSAEGWIWILIFFPFYILMVILAILKVKKLSKTDAPVDQDLYPPMFP